MLRKLTNVGNKSNYCMQHWDRLSVFDKWTLSSWNIQGEWIPMEPPGVFIIISGVFPEAIFLEEFQQNDQRNSTKKQKKTEEIKRKFIEG